MKRVTMKDVARAAGVSLSTVSRVLNDNLSVDSDLRKEVLDAIKQLGYQPNRSAQQLRSSISHVIGLIIADVENPFFTSVIRGIEDVAFDRQLNVLLCNTDEDPDKQQEYLKVMSEERVAGLIITPTFDTDPEQLRSLQQSGMPIVLLDRQIEELECDQVIVDNVAGAYTATRHLIELGHRRIAFVQGNLPVRTYTDRYIGYTQALTEASIQLDRNLVLELSPRLEDTYETMLPYLRSKQPPDAVFAANNLMTLGVLKAIKQAGLSVPEDIAVVGFDDMPWSGELCPPVTSVAQPTYELGQEAARLLIRRINDEKVFRQDVLLKTRFIIRASCGATINHDKKNE